MGLNKTLKKIRFSYFLVRVSLAGIHISLLVIGLVESWEAHLAFMTTNQ